MIKICWYGLLRVILLSFILTCAFSCAPYAAEDDQRVHIDADSVVYQENTGIATADGNVRSAAKTLRLFAPHVEYNSNNSQEAFPTKEERSIFSPVRQTDGKSSAYSPRRSGVRQTLPARWKPYMQGKHARVMPMEDAVKFGS